MTTLLLRVAAILGLSMSVPALPCLADSVPGVVRLAGSVGQERPLALSIWYPSSAGAATGAVGGTAVFRGTAAVLDAPPPAGKHRLVLLSHGGLRSAADSGAWLAAALAEDGFLVVEVNGPRPETADAAASEIWQRPRDIRRALDLILQDPVWAARVDPDRIAVVGFALGGTAALAVAGVELDAERYLHACDGPPRAEAPDCAWYAAQGAGVGRVDRARLAQSGRDTRIRAAVAVEPEYRSAFRASAAPSGVPMLLLSLGEAPPPAPELPEAERAGVLRATVFDAFSSCTDEGARILHEEEGNPALCGGSRQARAESHAAIAARIRDFLVACIGR